jgi:hypothetical protein
MKRIHLMPVLIAILAVHATLAMADASLDIKLKLAGTDFLLGEPIRIEQTIENIGKTPIVASYVTEIPWPTTHVRVLGKTSSGCVSSGGMEMGGLSVPAPLMPGQKDHPIAIRPETYGAVDVGDYELWVEYDTINSKGFGLAPYLTLIKTESNHVKIRILAPTGLDAEVFSRYSYTCNRMGFPYPEIVERYPLSTYAGYRLGGEPWLAPLGFNEKPETIIKKLWEGDFIGNHRMAITTRSVVKDGKRSTEVASVPMGDKLRSQSKKLQAFLALHPGFVQRESIERCLALVSLALKEKATAVTSLEWLRKNAPTDELKVQGAALVSLLAAADKKQPSQPDR